MRLGGLGDFIFVKQEFLNGILMVSALLIASHFGGLS